MSEALINVVKVFTIGFFSFLFAFFLTPSLTHFLYKHKLWKKKAKEASIDGKEVKYFRKFHLKKETATPRLGGLLIWISVLFIAFFLYFFSLIFDFFWAEKLNFLSRDQVWLPLFTLVSASIIGLVDDLLQVLDFAQIKNYLQKRKISKKIEKFLGKGLSLRYRLLMVGILGLIGAWWFYFQLEQSIIHIPSLGNIELGILYIPFFVIIMMAVYSGGVIDGIDGLSGGTFASIFTAYGAIALFQGQINLAAFSFAIVGSVLAFLWFNIPPARFYMGETGIIGLAASLTTVAFLTNAVIVLPIIAILLVVTSASVILQLLWKKFLKRKLFLSAPLHHHLEALGWPHYKITMRFWIIGVIAAILGITIHLLG